MLDVLLDVSRLDAGCIVPQPVPLSLNGIILPLAEEYALRARKRKLRIGVVPTSANVVSDPALLERILRNVIENALTSTPSGRILLGCRRRGGRVRLDVIDTGIGIDEDKVNLVFEEFYQVGNPERDRTKGLGLGLAIVQRLSRLLDHPIELASRPGRGTRFSLFLPAATAIPVHSHDAPAAADPQRSVGTILVIDDEALILNGLSGVLECWGYRVLSAESGTQAITAIMADRLAPDAIIADYRSRQGETGVDAIRLVHNHAGRAIPCLILTGDTSPHTIEAVRRANILLMHKPVAPTELQSTLTNLLATS